MALTISLNLTAATWDELRAYVELHKHLDGREEVGHSATNAAGEYDPELFEARENG